MQLLICNFNVLTTFRMIVFFFIFLSRRKYSKYSLNLTFCWECNDTPSLRAKKTNKFSKFSITVPFITEFFTKIQRCSGIRLLTGSYYFQHQIAIPHFLKIIQKYYLLNFNISKQYWIDRWGDIKYLSN